MSGVPKVWGLYFSGLLVKLGKSQPPPPARVLNRFYLFSPSKVRTLLDGFVSDRSCTKSKFLSEIESLSQNVHLSQNVVWSAGQIGMLYVCLLTDTTIYCSCNDSQNNRYGMVNPNDTTFSCAI